MKIEIPFRMLILGASGAGKTHFTKQLLKDQLMREFDQVFVFSSTHDVSDDWKQFEKDIVFFPLDASIVQKILDVQEKCIVKAKKNNEKHLCKKVLLIFDDFADNKKFMNAKPITSVAIRGRHCLISSMFLSQIGTGIPRRIRLQLTDWIVFKPYNGNEYTFIIEEFAPKHRRKQLQEQMETIFREPYQFIYRDCRSSCLDDGLIDREKFFEK